MKFELIEQYKGLPKQIYILLVARTIIAMGAFVFPFLTFFLSSRLGFSETQIAQYLLVVALSNLPAALIGGKLADKFNRKHVYVIVLLAADVFFILAGIFYEHLVVVLFILGGYCFINMGMPILSAMTMDITSVENRQESFSLLYLGYNLGFAVGPFVAGLLFEKYTQWIFWGQAGLSMAAVVMIVLFVKDCRAANVQENPGLLETDGIGKSGESELVLGRKDGGSLVYQLMKNPVIIVFAVLASGYAFSYAQMGFMMPLHMSDLFGISSGSKFFGGMWTLNGIAVAVATPIMVLIFKRRTALFNLAMAGVFYGVGFGLYSIFENLAVMYFLVLVWTSGEVLSATNTGVFIAEHAPETHRARFQSIYDIIQSLGRAFGPLLMGYYLVGRSSSSGWLLVGCVCGVAVVGFFIVDYWLQKKKAVAKQ